QQTRGMMASQIIFRVRLRSGTILKTSLLKVQSRVRRRHCDWSILRRRDFAMCSQPNLTPKYLPQSQPTTAGLGLLVGEREAARKCPFWTFNLRGDAR